MRSRPAPTGPGAARVASASSDERGSRQWLPGLLATAAALAVLALYGLPLLGTIFAVVQGGGIVLDDDGHVFMHDFLTHYAAGTVVLDGATPELYDIPVQHAAQEALVPDYRFPSVFLLPPVAALAFAPFGLLPYPLAAVLWAALSVLLIGAAVRAVWPLSPLRSLAPPILPAAVLAGSFPFAMNLGAGNNAAVWLALYAFGFRALFGGRDVLAGVILGFGALKPQLFLVVPVLLLAQGKRTALLAWSATAAALGAVSIAMVGPDGVRDYLGFLRSDRYEAGVATANAWRMPSLPAFVRSLWPEGGQLVTLGIVVIGMLLLAWAVRGATIPTASSAAVIVGVLIDPHLFAYDALVLAVPLLLWAGIRPRGAPRGAIPAFFVLTWLPLFLDSPEPGTLAVVPWAAAPLAVLAGAALRDARSESTGELFDRVRPETAVPASA